MITTQYFGAEIQNVQIQVVRTLTLNDIPQDQKLFVFSHKVLSQTYTVKYSQDAATPINPSTINIALNYDSILVQLGQGGPNVGDPYAYVRSGYGNLYTWDNNEPYDVNGLLKTKFITSVSSSIAGNLMEVTCVYGLLLSAPTVYIGGTATQL